MVNVKDWRNIATGRVIPTESYCDQPYIIKADDGAWLCVVTTGVGVEGAAGQHVATMRSTDLGATWSEPVDVEPADGPEASYAVLLKAPGGRLYCFYNHNTDNVRRVRADDPPFAGGYCERVDSLGYHVLKYSDDHGRTWSEERYPIPVRETEIDRENPYGGEICYFWNVGKPFIHDGAAYVSLHKVGGYGYGFFTRSEGVLLISDNLLTESDPSCARWETLPDGDAGLRTPPGGGPVAEEQSYSVLSDGSFYSVYRTIDGHPACAYSRDGGHTWTTPQYASYADGRPMKHPRAANFCWKCSNDKYLYWFHNHGGRFIRGERVRSYEDRNPVWLCGGIEADTPEGKVIRWSQPEIVLYDDDPYIRMSYPDLIEDGGRYFLTETQKNVARVHEVPATFLEKLWEQFEASSVTTEGLALELSSRDGALPPETPMPRLPAFTERDRSRADHGTRQLCHGLALDLWIRFNTIQGGQVILDSRTENGQGLALETTGRGTVRLVLNDGRTGNAWDCEPGLLQPGKLHHLAVSVDGGPRIITFVVDGRLCDGGAFRQFGWGRFSPHLREANGSKVLRIAPSLQGRIEQLRIYDRHLLISEAIGNWRAGL